MYTQDVAYCFRRPPDTPTALGTLTDPRWSTCDQKRVSKGVTLGKKMGQHHSPRATRTRNPAAVRGAVTDRLTVSSAGPAPQRMHKIYNFYLVTANLNTAESGGILLLNVITP